MPRSRSSILPRQSANATAAEPIASSELGTLFGSFSGFGTIALAVSGGPDSLALMHLALDWRTQLTSERPHFIVLTLDHGLRPEAAQEAADVAAAAIAVGLPAQILTRSPHSSPTAIQETARADRYRLLVAAARSAGAKALATAHTLDDQAETLLMRLSRGSGIDGLSAMAPVTEIGGLTLLRPLLSVPKTRLEATLRARGIPWTVDPGNSNTFYERPRLRAAMSALAAAGLTNEAMALSARRLNRGRAALDWLTTQTAASMVISHAAGYFEISRPGFDPLPEELRLRLLSRLIGRLSPPGSQERLARLERLVAMLGAKASHRASLAGCLILAAADRILICREPGRLGLPQIEVNPGHTVDWDRRFRVGLAASANLPVTVRALLEADLTGDLATLVRACAAPRQVILSALSIWRGGSLVAIPLLRIVSAQVTILPLLGAPAQIHDDSAQ